MFISMDYGMTREKIRVSIIFVLASILSVGIWAGDFDKDDFRISVNGDLLEKVRSYTAGNKAECVDSLIAVADDFVMPDHDLYLDILLGPIEKLLVQPDRMSLVRAFVGRNSSAIKKLRSLPFSGHLGPYELSGEKSQKFSKVLLRVFSLYSGQMLLAIEKKDSKEAIKIAQESLNTIRLFGYNLSIDANSEYMTVFHMWLEVIYAPMINYLDIPTPVIRSFIAQFAYCYLEMKNNFKMSFYYEVGRFLKAALDKDLDFQWRREPDQFTLNQKINFEDEYKTILKFAEEFDHSFWDANQYYRYLKNLKKYRKSFSQSNSLSGKYAENILMIYQKNIYLLSRLNCYSSASASLVYWRTNGKPPLTLNVLDSQFIGKQYVKNLYTGKDLAIRFIDGKNKIIMIIQKRMDLDIDCNEMVVLCD